MRYKYLLISLLTSIILSMYSCRQSGQKSSLAFVSPHLELDSYDFQKAAKGYESVMKTDLYGVSGDGTLPVFSVAELSKHDLVIFESFGARISLLKPQIDSLKAKTKVLFLETPLGEGNVSLKQYPDIKTYWANASNKNYSGLLSYIAAKVFKQDVPVQKPVAYPESGFYHPGSDTLFHTAHDYFNWYNRSHPLPITDTSKPVIGVVFYQSNYVKHDMRHIDALIKSIEKHGARPVALMQKSGFKLDSFLVVNHKPVVDVVLYGGMFLNFSHPEKGRKAAENLDVPLLGTVTHYYKDPAAWEKEPGGFAPDMTDRFYFTERDGVIEPMIVGADQTQENKQRYVVPISYQIDWRVERAIAWVKLRRSTNDQKKIVCAYFNEGNGKANVGADIDAYLDVPASLVKLLKVWKDKGYNVGSRPLPTAAELAHQMSIHASNVGTWAPAELKKRISNGEVITIPEKEYLKWFSTYPLAQQKQVIQKWGPPPGKLMTVTDSSGQKEIIIPILKYGNIILAPHPNWGLQDNPGLIYGKDEIPPNHDYIAFYEWMKRVYQPHAFLSLFTQLSLMPGKLEGPSRKDFTGELIGNLPHISMVPLIANGGVANKRRASALTIGYLTEITQAGLSDSLKLLSNKIEDWQSATNPAIKSKLQQKAILMIRQLHVDKDLDRTALTDSKPDLLLKEVQSYLTKIAQQHMPNGSHILGNAPAGESLVEMVTGMLGKEFEQLLPGPQKNRSSNAKAMIRALLIHHSGISQVEKSFIKHPDSLITRQLQKAIVYQQQLSGTTNEITQLMRALDGKYITTGPSDDPIRNPESLPSGRNPYGVNVKNIPTQEAWDLGKRMADQLLLQYENKHGKGAYPKKVAFVLWSSEVVNSQGVTEAEIMNLIGVKPVWNSKGQIMDVALIPAATLGRPRIDVLITTSGTYRDHFSGNIKILDKAVKLASTATEPDNWVRIHSLAYQKKLHIDSLTIASLRIFSSNQGAYSTNLEFASEHGESWKKDTTLSNLYIKRMAHAYGENVSAYYQKDLFTLNIKDIDAAAFSRSSNVYGIMDHPMVAAYFGAYNLVVKNTTGHQPDMFINDMQDNANPAVMPLSEFFHAELRSRYLNPKWIKGMMDHGYDGARYMDSFAENFFLWDVTTPDMVKDQDWNDVYDTYVKDKYKLNLSKYLDKANPYAKQSMLSSMLEASEKGYWKASKEQLTIMAKEVATSVVKNGPACNTAVCNSPSLSVYIKHIIDKVPGSKPLSDQYTSQLKKIQQNATPATAPASGAKNTAEQVSGQQITEEKLLSPATPQQTGTLMILIIAGFITGLFGLGWINKK